MKLLGILVAVFSVVAVAVGVVSGHAVLYLLAGFGILAAFTTYRSVGISSFLRILIVYFSVETVVLGACVCVNALGHWPSSLENVRIPSTVAMTVAMFSIVSYLTSYIPVARKTLTITDRYFRAETKVALPFGIGPRFAPREKTLAAGAIMFIILLNQLEVWFSVLMTFASSDISNALQTYNANAFWKALLIEFPLYLTPFLIALFIEFFAANTLAIRWRRWLTQDYTRRWLDHHNHYGMMLAGVGTDNPDQRIQEDIPRFIDGGQFGGLGVYNFSINLISQMSSLVSYSIILWGLSSHLTFPGTSFQIPGFLLWCAVVYAVLGTGATALIGRPLARLAFARQHYEANFRFGLARLREYCEQIALLFGEMTEESILKERFVSVVRNFYSIVYVKAFLSTFIQFFNNINQFIPYIILGPFYFARTATLGDLTQASIAFGSVNSSLTFFVSYYSALADFKSVLDRLTTFDASLDAVPAPRAIVALPAPRANDFQLSNVTIRLPTGKVLASYPSLRLAANENVLISGASGSGKSTFFRAISGVWPYVEGTIEGPEQTTVMVLPQKPYLPIGTLFSVVSYPHPAGTYDEALIKSVLVEVGLPHLVEWLDIDDNWTQRLSGGEQQRIAIARAILARPKWLLLDEATAAMDMKLEERIYTLIARRLPETTVLSIAHRGSLFDHHKRHLVMQPTADGTFALEEMKLAAE
jgi:putative ATP-binding cassette transporter